MRKGYEKVVVVSCKAYQTGFYADRFLAQLRGEAPNPKRRARWLSFRELWNPKWAAPFIREVETRTGSDRFTYYLAVTHLRGDPSAWETDPTIQRNLRGNPLKFLTLESMWARILTTVTTTPAASEVGRLAQLLKAAGLTAPVPVAPPADLPPSEWRSDSQPQDREPGRVPCCL